MLSLKERAQVASRFEVWRSVTLVQRWWRGVRGPHATLDAKTIRNCHTKLMTTGSVVDKPRSGRPSVARSPENVAAVRDMFTRSPGKSTRQAARESGISRHTVRVVLKKDLIWKPWKPYCVQELSLEDCDRRMEYGEIMLSWHSDWPDVFRNIIWSDEAVFHVGGFVNRHNCHYWAETNPGMTIEKSQGRPKLTVWCGMTADRIIGPFILRDTMNSDRYHQMLNEYVWPQISQWDNVADIIFQQDGAPPHFAIIVRDWLDEHFPGRWLGRRGPHEWPARSPDLTPCDFFLWGWAKEEVYRTRPSNLDELEERIRAVLENVPQDFLQKSIDDIPKRLRRLVDNAGAYVEF